MDDVTRRLGAVTLSRTPLDGCAYAVDMWTLTIHIDPRAEFGETRLAALLRLAELSGRGGLHVVPGGGPEPVEQAGWPRTA